jgi:hypothetical protein
MYCTGTAWEQIENHKGESGYLDGKPHAINAYGPLPDGWSDTPPLPTPAEIANARLAEIQARLREIDADRSRPLSDLALKQYEVFARQKLTALETERAALVEEKDAIEAELKTLAAELDGL